MSTTFLAPPLAPDTTIDLSLASHVGALRQYIVGVLAREGERLEPAVLDELSESVLAEAVRLAVRWVEEER